MQIVIDIPDRLIKKVKDHYVNPYEVDEICEAILDGTPLPKGHGRLIDADELLKQSYRIDDSATLSTRDVVNVEEIDNAPTIIEADKAESESKK